MGSGDFLVDTPRYVRMYLDGILDLDSLVTGRIPLESINDGFDLMRSGVTARTVITFEADG
jgi:S-(hydroxymethyl)glutathione dehydrogenase/alcohol dehydrogenase